MLKLCSLQEFFRSVFKYCVVRAKQLQQIWQSFKGWPIKCYLSNQNDIMHCPFFKKEPIMFHIFVNHPKFSINSRSVILICVLYFICNSCRKMAEFFKLLLHSAFSVLLMTPVSCTDLQKTKGEADCVPVPSEAKVRYI